MSASPSAPMPARGAVRVESIQVDRTPGIPNAFGVEELSPGLNLVFGPNASGKSSLLRALDALLWPTLEGAHDRSVRGRLHNDARSWDVRLDGTARTVHTADGVRIEAPVWPSPALRHRLHFALHDLLVVSQDADAFAEAIVRASAGGLDIVRAGEAMGMLERAPRVLAARRQYDEAGRAVAEAQQRQRALHEERLGLDRLREERDAARDASGQLQLLERAQAWRAARTRLAHAEAELAVLPAALAQMRGHELEHAVSTRAAWRDAQARRAAALERCAHAEAAQRAAFETAPPTLEHRERWRRGLEALRRADTALDRTRVQVAERRAARDAAARALTPLDTHSAPPVDQGAVSEAAAVASRLEAALAAQTEAVAHAAMLDAVHAAPTASADRDALRDAVRLLADWLVADAVRRVPPTASREGMHWTLTAGAVIGWVVVAIVWHLAGALLALVVLAIALWWRPRGHAAERDEAAARCLRLEAEYSALGVPAPGAWDTVSVVALLDVLARAIGDATVDARHREERRRATADVARAQAALEAQQRDAAALAARTGLAPDTEGRTLGWLFDRLARFQEAHSECVRAEAAWQQAQHDHTMARQHFADAHEVPLTLVDAEALVAAREARWDAYASAAHELAQATDAAQHAEAECARHAESWEALFRAVALDAPPLTPSTAERPADAALAALQARLEQRTLWLAQDSVRVNALRDLAQLRGMVHDADAFDGLSALPDEVLSERIATVRARADTFESCVHRVSTLEARLQLAAQSCAVQDALATRARCRDAVVDDWTETVGAVITHALVAHVQRETRDVQRPAVFHRARSLFLRITRGRWRLHVDEHESVAHFRAEDTTTGEHHALATLSAGTRVQLLVAVRVAFVESEEIDGMQLPLFFDETLGTSDDERAEALIEAVLTLVAEGRQLFYVTAQRDEVQKWHAALAARAERGADVPWRDVDLAVVRRLAPLQVPARIPAPRPDRTLPAHALRSHAAFGAATRVPPVDPARTPVARWPLWYLTDDVPLLHATWRLGVECWGELAGYREAGGRVSVPGRSAQEHTAALDALSHVAELAEQLHALSAVGIGRPVNRRVLRDAGVVTPAFLDLVVAQAERVHGDAGELLAALATGAVPRFGSSKVEQLRSVLVAGGWLDEAMSLSGEEIRWGVIARSARHDAAELVDALLERLRRGAAPDPEHSHATPSP